MNTVVQEEPGSSNNSCSSSSKDQLTQQTVGPPIKRRKRHRRKNLHSQEACMRGVYFKNMKWQAAIKVVKKQIHLGTVGSQEEAAHLYAHGVYFTYVWLTLITKPGKLASAAFMCGREPNFELPEEEKQELHTFKWDDFLAMTRQAITRKKLKRRISPELPNSLEMHRLHKDDCDKESQKATSTAKLGGGDDVELQNGMTVSIVTAYGSLKVHLIQSLAVLTVYGGEGFLISGDGTHIKT
ncbi:Integrase-type DNA-binding superfamily protein [Trifolium repens]|nr:Integrase-type DNA-binding superfamily protein [Trifolium repens]